MTGASNRFYRRSRQSCLRAHCEILASRKPRTASFTSMPSLVRYFVLRGTPSIYRRWRHWENGMGGGEERGSLSREDQSGVTRCYSTVAVSQGGTRGKPVPRGTRWLSVSQQPATRLAFCGRWRVAHSNNLTFRKLLHLYCCMYSPRQTPPENAYVTSCSLHPPTHPPPYPAAAYPYRDVRKGSLERAATGRICWRSGIC